MRIVFTERNLFINISDLEFSNSVLSKIINQARYCIGYRKYTCAIKIIGSVDDHKQDS